MVLDLAGLDAMSGVTIESLLGVVTPKRTRLLTDIAISNLRTCCLKIRASMTLVLSVRGNVRLVTHASEVVCEAVPHVFDRVNLAVLHPLVVLVPRVQPEREPV